MRIYTLERQQVVPADIKEVFAFFCTPENLGRLTPQWLGFQLLTPLPLSVRRGALIEYALHWLGFPLRWTTLITAFEQPHRFVDEQLRGPYSFWHHTHAFQSVPGGTEMTDAVRYAMPCGLLGRFTHMLVIKHQLTRIFDYRAAIVDAIFREQSDVSDSFPGNASTGRFPL